MTMQQRRRATSLGLFFLGGGIGVLIAAERGLGFELAPWARLVVWAIVLAATVVLTLNWWKVLDEVAREAHKFAWYWGGSAGMAVAALVMTLVDKQKIAVPLLRGPMPEDAFVTGALSVMMAQLVGYTVAWAGWWWSRR